MRDFAVAVSGLRALQTWVYWAQFVLAVWVLSFPLAVYRDHVREHRYGLSNLTFGGWLGEEMKGLALAIVLAGVAAMALYAVVRKAPRTWWVWGAAVSVAFIAFGALIGPVVITPIFNSPKKLEDAREIGRAS